MPFFIIKAFFKQLKKTLDRSDFGLSLPSDVEKKTMSAIILKILISKEPGQNSQKLGLNANIATTLSGCICLLLYINRKIFKKGIKLYLFPKYAVFEKRADLFRR